MNFEKSDTKLSDKPSSILDLKNKLLSIRMEQSESFNYSQKSHEKSSAITRMKSCETNYLSSGMKTKEDNSHI